VSDVRDKFLKATYLVSKASGGEWPEFIKAFDEYVIYELERMTTTPPSEVLVALGVSRNLLQLRYDFKNIETLAMKLKAR
jgi:hypothetical protein